MGSCILLIRLLQFAFQYFFPVVVLFLGATVLPAAEFSALAIVMSVAVFFRPFLGLSIGKAAIRPVSYEFVNSSKSGAYNLSVELMVLAIALSFPGIIIVSILVVSMPYLFHEEISFNYNWVFPVLYILAFGLEEAMDGVLRANHKYYTLAFSNILIRTLAVFWLVYDLSHYNLVEKLLVFLVCVEGLVLLSQIVCFLWRVRKGIFEERLGLIALFKKHKKIIKYGGVITLSAVAAYLYAKSGVLVLGVFQGPEEVGAFELAFQVYSIPLAVMIVLGGVVSPMVAKSMACSSGGFNEIEKIISCSMSLCLFVNGGVVVYFYLIGGEIIDLFFDQYSYMKILLMLLMPLVLMKSVIQILTGEIGVVLGQASLIAKNSMLAAVANVLVMGLAVSFYGVVGLVVGMFFVHVVSGGVVFLVMLSRLNLRIKIKFNELLGVLLVSVTGVLLVRYIYNDIDVLRDSLIYFSCFSFLLVIGLLKGKEKSVYSDMRYLLFVK